MRRIAELPWGGAFLTPPSDDFSIKRHDADALSPFSDVDNVIGINKQIVRGTKSSPFSKVFAVRVENLASEVTPVQNIDAFIAINGDIVREVKFAGPRARRAPRNDDFPISRHAMHARLSVTIGNIHLTGCGEDSARRFVKRCAGRARLIDDAERLQQFTRK